MAQPSLSVSAHEFMNRLDQAEDITRDHPIFLVNHPEDEEEDLSARKMRRFCFTNVPPPIISITSHKAEIRRIATKNKELFDSLPQQLHIVSSSFLRPMLPSSALLLARLLRPLFCLLASVYLVHGICAQSSNISLRVAVCASVLSTVFYSMWNDSRAHQAFVQVPVGVYHNSADTLITKVLNGSEYLNGTIQYSDLRCPFLFDADLRTAIPFTLFAPDDIAYTRRWVKNIDGEAVAFDISFPTRLGPDGKEELYHDPSKIVHICQFGLNGGSNEPYILDFVQRMNQAGHTSVCLITRGFMGTPIVNYKIFDATRISDLENVVRSMHIACGNGLHDDFMSAPVGTYTTQTAFKHDVMHRSAAIANKWWTTPICVSGFSLGGIITSNYCVTMGDQTGIISAVGIATSGDALVNMTFEPSVRIWQGFLTFAAKANIICPQQHILAPNGPAQLPIDLDAVANISSIVEFDRSFTTRYLGYDSVEEYYRRMSFALDSRLKNLHTPLLIIHASDDPIITVNSLKSAYDAIRDQQVLNLALIITDGGGHCGFPTGWNPFSERWDYATRITREFSNQVFSTVQLATVA